MHSYCTGGNLEDCRSWFGSVFSNLGFNNYEQWTDVREKTYRDLIEFGGIYIGGGNTFSLMHDFRKTGFNIALSQFIINNRPVHGGSAGAIIFGKTIETAELGKIADINSVGLENKTGFNFVGGHAIHCHYEMNFDKKIRNFVIEKGISVIALSECSGLFVTNETLKVIGLGPAYLFTGKEKNKLPVNSIVKLN